MAIVDEALVGVRSVYAEFGLISGASVHWPGWRTVINGWDEKTWLRTDVGSLVHEGDRIFTITNPFKTDSDVVATPFTGLLVSILKNLLVYPGNPLCHLVKLDE